MPAFLTHYACGIAAFHRTEDCLVRRAVKEHPAAYNTGLAGPDIFFYSLPQWIRENNMTTGRIMHIQQTGAFLRFLYHDLCCRSREEKQIAIAYLAGFLGHYSLDCCAHALVYHICAHESETVALGRHFRYEAAMDVFCCRHVLNRDIRQSHQLELIRIDRKERRVISEMISGGIREAYPSMVKKPGAFRMKVLLTEYYLLSGLILDPGGFKEWLVFLAEHLFPGYPLVSPLLINSNTYGLTEKDWARFEIRFRRGVRMHARLLKTLDHALAGETDEKALFSAIGNRSYHSGRTLQD